MITQAAEGIFQLRPSRLLPFLTALLFSWFQLQGQVLPAGDTMNRAFPSTGWADEAVTIGYVTAPSVLGLMFISALVSEWNAGYAGIPASAMILLAPPVIYMGGRSVGIPLEISNSRARLGWTLYALSAIPTAMALYGFGEPAMVARKPARLGIEAQIGAALGAGKAVLLIRPSGFFENDLIVHGGLRDVRS
jgi:hypothetical protein